MTISAIELTVSYCIRAENFGPKPTGLVTVSEPEDLLRLGVIGPRLPVRVDAYDQEQWRIPRRFRSVPENVAIGYKFRIRTAHQDKWVESNEFTWGGRVLWRHKTRFNLYSLEHTSGEFAQFGTWLLGRCARQVTD